MDREQTGSPRRGTLLVVAGAGRSGTSLFSGLVSRLGLYIPRPEVAANRSNPRGFSEPRWAVDFHKELLASLDVAVEDSRPEAWDLVARVAERPRVRRKLKTWLEEQFVQSDRVVVKDPRLARFLDLYRTVVADLPVDLRVVTMLRHPTETMTSREIAYGTGVGSTTRLAGWLNLMQSVEFHTRDLPRATIKYEDLLTDWRAALAAAEQPLDLPLVSQATEDQIKEADSLVDVSLRRSTSDWSSHDVPESLRTLGERTYQALATASVGGAPAAVDSRLTMDELRAEYVELYRHSEAIARSSITAARAQERRRLQKRMKAATSAAESQAQAAQDPTADSAARRNGADAIALARRLKRRVWPAERQR